MTEPRFQLSASARKTLQAICETFLPSLPARDDESRVLYALSARQLGVADAIEQAVGHLRAPQQREFRILLGALGNPASMLALSGHFASFEHLDEAARVELLLRLANSPIPQLRTAFQVLKRLSTYLFYAVTPNGNDNPTWPEIGYPPSRNPPAIERPLRVTIADRDRRVDCDVCVVGSGAGGSVIAAELAAAGKHVVVLEAAQPLQPPDYDQRELAGTEHLFLEHGLLATTDSGVILLAGAALGGGTVVNWQTSLRTPDDIRNEWAQASGCPHFTDRSFSFALDAVCARASVGTDESVINANNDVIRRGAELLGHGWKPIPRNARGCDLAQCGYCSYGCRHGGKQSTAVTFLRDAQRLGDCEIIGSARAERVRIAGGRVTGVDAIAIGADGRRHTLEIRASVVVAAGGSIETPALLLRSRVENRQIGRNLYVHPVTAVAGLFPESIEPWKGPPQTVVCDRFSRIDGLYGFMMEVAPAHPALLALALPWTDARQHRQRMSHVAHCAATIMIVRDRSTGRVTVDRAGRAVVDYQPGATEIALLRKGLVEGARVQIAAGASEIATLHQREHGFVVSGASLRQLDADCDRLAASEVTRNRSTLFSAHQMGSCRMGSDPARAVCDARGAVFGVRGLHIGDASAFPLSSGVNPMITIMAMAHHTAQGLK